MQSRACDAQVLRSPKPQRSESTTNVAMRQAGFKVVT